MPMNNDMFLFFIIPNLKLNIYKNKKLPVHIIEPSLLLWYHNYVMYEMVMFDIRLSMK